MRKGLIVTAMLVCFALVAGAAESSPIGILLLDSNGNSSGVIADGSAGDGDAADGIVSFNGVIGDWAVNGTVGGWSNGVMDLFSINLSGQTTSSLFVLFTSLDNTALAGGFELSFATALQNASAA